MVECEELSPDEFVELEHMLMVARNTFKRDKEFGEKYNIPEIVRGAEEGIKWSDYFMSLLKERKLCKLKEVV